MINVSHFSLKQLPTLLLALLFFGIVLSACGSNASNVGSSANTNDVTPTESKQDELAYDKSPGHILVQVFSEPGFVIIPIIAVPEWTLYGDGTLIYKSTEDGAPLVEAKLTPDEVQGILKFIVEEHDFFYSSKETYGELVPDIGVTRIIVNTVEQQKMVKLLLRPSEGQKTDTETKNVFAIHEYLLNYRPAKTQPYNAPGVVVMVIPNDFNEGAPTEKWPYEKISLQRIADQECTYSYRQRPCPRIAQGLFPIFGKAGLDLINNWSQHAYMKMTEQDGKLYQVMVWPILPDALVKQADGKEGVYTTGVNEGRKPLLPGEGSGTAPKQ